MVTHHRDRYDLPHRARQFITADWDDPAAFDNGVLRDGHKVRVPMNMMDSAPLRQSSTAPLVISRQSVVDEKIRRQYDEIISARATDASRKRRVRDQSRETVSVSLEDAHSGHRPGFRNDDAARSASEQAYSEMCRDLQDEWKSPERRLADARSLTVDAPPAGVSAAEFERARMIQDVCSAWQDAPAPKLAPFGAYPVGFNPKAGDQCSQDGAKGVLVERNGYLYCQVEPMPSARSGTSSGSDALLRNTRNNMSAADGERLKSEAWNQMVSDLENSWRTPQG
jgi:hypothetical protein